MGVTNIIIDSASIASTIGKAAIVVLVTFSVPLQVHPCRASLDAVFKWRPNNSSSTTAQQITSGSLLPSASNSRPERQSVAVISDLRFALLTTFILLSSYVTALSVSSLDRVLAFVGSTGSTSISFILPGLFFYIISDPESTHHQRLSKEDDDLIDSTSSDSEDLPTAAANIGSILSAVSGAASESRSMRWRRKWRWDFEHLDHGLLRRLALALAIYGFGVMVVCLSMNTWALLRDE
jgi:hypothetical protein